MNGQEKISLLLELKNTMTAGFMKAKEMVRSSTGAMNRDIADLKMAHVEAFRSMSAEVPMFGRAMELLGNPYVLVTAGIVALGALVGSTVSKAAEFNAAFLPIRQLNLDKPAAEMDAYKASIKQAAFDVGADLIVATQAFSDLQGGADVFGKDAVAIFKEVGMYSQLSGANLGDSTNSVVKAMKAFKLEAKDIHGLLESNAKTVAVGIVSYDELARVQTEYAGAAAMAGQSVDTSNKLFAAFTSIAKDAVTGATMTKSAFEGLTQANTVKGLTDIGVKMYDAHGNMRKLDDIIKDVAVKFKGMDSKSIDTVINKIGGPEGLRNLLGKVKTGADDIIKTFAMFDNTTFDFNKALANAKGDVTVMAEIARNRLGIVMTSIGERILPMWVVVLEKVNTVVQFVFKHIDDIVNVTRNLAIAAGVALVVWGAIKMVMFVINAEMKMLAIGTALATGGLSLIIPAIAAAIAYLTVFTEGWADSWDGIYNISKYILQEIGLRFEYLSLGASAVITNIKLNFQSLGQYLSELFSNIGTAFNKAISGDFSGAKKAISAKIVTDASVEQTKYNTDMGNRASDITTQIGIGREMMSAYAKQIGIRYKKDEPEVVDITGTGKDKADKKVSDIDASGSALASNSMNAVTGSAKQVKNITVNVETLGINGGLHTTNQEIGKMSPDQLDQWFSNMLMRSIRNLEMSY